MYTVTHWPNSNSSLAVVSLFWMLSSVSVPLPLSRSSCRSPGGVSVGEKGLEWEEQVALTTHQNGQWRGLYQHTDWVQLCSLDASYSLGGEWDPDEWALCSLGLQLCTAPTCMSMSNTQMIPFSLMAATAALLPAWEIGGGGGEGKHSTLWEAWACVEGEGEGEGVTGSCLLLTLCHTSCLRSVHALWSPLS